MKLSSPRLLLSSAIAVLGLSLALPAALARGPGFGDGGGRGGRGAGRMLQALDLTDAQLTSLETLRDKHQAEMKPLRDQQRAKREALKALWQAPTLDRAKLVAATQDLATTHIALQLKRIDHLMSLRSVLTPEQFQKFVAMKGPGGGEGFGGRGKRGHRGGRGGHGPGFGGPDCDGSGRGPGPDGPDDDEDAE